MLRSDLPKECCYHSLDHTLDVMREVLRLGLHDNLIESDLRLLAIAAAYHDLGYITGPLGHEQRGAGIARQRMQAAGFSESDITEVEQSILATEVVSTETGPVRYPSTRLSRYLLDADVANLGRGDFLAWADLVRKERNESREDFLAGVLLFTKAHVFYTAAATALLQDQKDRNLQMLNDLMSARGQ